MESFLFSINAVLPIILLIALGYFLKKRGMVTVEIAKKMNKLVFRIFLPAMLFLNVYRIESIGDIDFFYIWYALITVFCVFILAIPAVILFTKNGGQRGVLLQVAFRSNYTLIGIPLAAALFGDEGVVVTSTLTAFAVVLFNVLAVISLSMFSEGKSKVDIKHILLDILKNPLIIATAIAGICIAVRPLLACAEFSFRLSDITPLMKALEYLGAVATPLALISLGAQFEFSSAKNNRRAIIFGTAVRTAIVPMLGVGIAYLFFREKLNGAHFAAFVAYFATPAAVSSVPMAQEMGADTELAGQLVVSTTIVSAFVIFLVSAFLKSVGIF